MEDVKGCRKEAKVVEKKPRLVKKKQKGLWKRSKKVVEGKEPGNDQEEIQGEEKRDRNR